jgi:DNA-binding response OmpR family regulator
MPDKKYNILLMEDDVAIASMYKIKFEQAGFNVTIFDNGADGLEYAKKAKPDIILLDVMMPQLDGFAVLEEIRSDISNTNIPVIMLTNLSTEEDKLKGKKFGATDYLVKADLTPAQVNEIVKKYLKI